MTPLVETRDLCVYFPATGTTTSGARNVVKAVDGVSLAIYESETLAIVGESGSGKSTLGQAILGLHKPTSGSIFVYGKDMKELSSEERKALRGKFSIVFQDPLSSLDPRMKVKDIIAEPLLAAVGRNRSELVKRISDALVSVGLQPSDMFRLPHEFSGGQKQKICIARAIVTNPKLVVLDEPTSALDISVQAEILNLLKKIQKDHGLSYLFITHNINVAKYMSDRIGVMYAGKLAEIGGVRAIIESPRHPYTVALLRFVPSLYGNTGYVFSLSGEVPSPTNPPAGCRFHPRCWMAKDICRVEPPPMKEFDRVHYSACHFAEQVISE
jgi:oligopeptide/dipeptide ABC transporter ATP-binding protein